MTSPNSDHIRLKSPVDVAASIPYLLGFVPNDSTVLLFIDRERSTVVFVCRLDYPLPAEAGGLEPFSKLCQRAATEGATSVAIIMYPAVGDTNFGRFSANLVAVAEDAGLEVVAWGAVSWGTWIDLDDPTRTPVEIAKASSAVASEWVGQRRSFLPDRKSLEACVSGPETPLALDVRRLVDQNLARPVANLNSANGRRHIEQSILDYLTDPRANVPEPEPVVLATWIAGLLDSRVREPVLWRLAKPYFKGADPDTATIRRAVDRLAFICRNCPHEAAAPVASTLAAAAWQSGNGALALIAADYSLKCDPNNTLADVVQEALGRGVPPRIWISILGSMSMSDMRKGRARATHPARSRHHRAKRSA